MNWRKLLALIFNRDQREKVMGKKTNMADDPMFSKLLDKITEAGAKLSSLAVSQGEHGPQRVTLALAALSGPLANLVVLTGRRDTKEFNSDHMLFAALLAAHAVEPTKDGSAILQFSPTIVLEALTSFEKLTGKKADGFLQEDMVGSARETEKEGCEPLAAFMSSLKPSSPPH